MKRNTTINLVFILSLSLIALFSLSSQVLCAESLTKVSIRLQWVPQAQFAGVYVAKEKGFYKEEGLDVNIYPGGANFNAIQLVSAGTNDFGIWTADQLILARANNAPVHALAAIFQKTLACWITKNDSGIKSPMDFPGHTVGVNIGYDLETYYIALMKKLNIDRSKIKEVPTQLDIARFFHGDVDVWPSYVINQPLLAEEKGFHINIIKPSDYGIDGYSDILFTSDDFVKSHPETVKKFVSATLRGWEWAISHLEESAKLVVKQEEQLNFNHELAMMKVLVPYVKPTAETRVGAMDPNVWNNIYQILLDQGTLTKKVDLDSLYMPIK